TFSTYKETSEISRLNRGQIHIDQCDEAVREVIALGEKTRQETRGYFNIWRGGYCDPLGIVKGWAIHNATSLLTSAGYNHFYIDAGGDLQVMGKKEDLPWKVGIRNPFHRQESVKVLSITDRGVATSGTAIRGQHIYDPLHPDASLLDVASITVIGP